MTHELGVNGTDLGFMVTSIGPMVCPFMEGRNAHQRRTLVPAGPHTGRDPGGLGPPPGSVRIGAV